MRPVEVSDDTWGGDWMCHPDIDAEPGSDEAELIAGRDRAMVVTEWSDCELSYEYDDYAVVLLDGIYYLLNTSGCSCPSPSETWHVMISGNLDKVARYMESHGEHPAEFHYHREKVAATDMAKELRASVNQAN